jgi:hypothetical protein
MFDEPVTLAPLTLELSPPDDEAVAESPITFEPLQLDSPERLPMASASKPAPPPAPPATGTPTPTREVVEPPEADEPMTVRTTPPVVIVPALGDVTSGPEQLAPAPLAAPHSAPPSGVAPTTEALPEIREATPFVGHSGPTLPSMPAAVPGPTAAASFQFDHAAIAPVHHRQHQRRSSGRGLKLVVTLLVLGGLVAAGVIFGQPYLFPGEWDSATAPYAEAVEVARGVDFAEPLAIVAEPTDNFADRLQSELAPVSAEEFARWRALGLVSGTVDENVLARQLTGWQDALYSSVDGTVYHDLGAAGPELDAQLVREMAAASLDQEFGWSLEQPQRTLDEAVATSTEVLRQATAVQQSSTFDAAVAPVPSELIGPLPPVIGYRMLAPHVFVEFDASTQPAERTNPLAELGASGAGTVGAEESDVVTPAVAEGRSFWYLVFASYLDAGTAYAASEAVVESSLNWVELEGVQCASATFSGGGVDETAGMGWALAAWASAAPAEMSSSFQVLPDGSLQLVSCDPGAGFDAGVRPGVARELLAWRMAEFATTEAVRFGGGGEAELVEVWRFVQASPVVTDLVALPATATSTEMAAAARDAVNALFVPAG